MVIPLAVLPQKRVEAGFVVCDQSLGHIFRMRTVGDPPLPQPLVLLTGTVRTL